MIANSFYHLIHQQQQFEQQNIHHEVLHGWHVLGPEACNFRHDSDSTESLASSGQVCRPA